MADVNGTKLHYHVTGDGIPIVFIHPPLLNSANFNYQEAQLSEAFKIITFDIRGHGLSAASSEPLTFSLIAEDMKQLLDYLGIEKAFVCGYSAGGTVALHALRTYPDRFSGGILVSAMSEVSDFRLRWELRLITGLAKLRFRRLLSAGFAWGNSDSSWTYRSLYGGSHRRDFKNIEQYFRESLTYSCTERLREIKQPVLLLCGDKNSRFRRCAEQLEERLPNSTIHVLNGVSHHIPTKAAARMNGLIQCWITEYVNGKADETANRQDPSVDNIPFMADEMSFGESTQDSTI